MVLMDTGIAGIVQRFCNGGGWIRCRCGGLCACAAGPGCERARGFFPAARAIVPGGAGGSGELGGLQPPTGLGDRDFLGKGDLGGIRFMGGGIFRGQASWVDKNFGVRHASLAAGVAIGVLRGCRAV